MAHLQDSLLPNSPTATSALETAPQLPMAFPTSVLTSTDFISQLRKRGKL